MTEARVDFALVCMNGHYLKMCRVIVDNSKT